MYSYTPHTLLLFLSLSLSHTHTLTHTHARTHTHTLSLSTYISERDMSSKEMRDGARKESSHKARQSDVTHSSQWCACKHAIIEGTGIISRHTRHVALRKGSSDTKKHFMCVAS